MSKDESVREGPFKSGGKRVRRGEITEREEQGSEKRVGGGRLSERDNAEREQQTGQSNRNH